MNRPSDHPVWRIGDARAALSRTGDTPTRARPWPGPRAASTRTLRLADDRGAAAAAAQPQAIDPRVAVARENRLASGMSPLDARWVFALKASQLLEGGTAAILRPEHRRRLMTQAHKIGLRDFDANLIIAIVQDGRRSGRGALNPDVEQRLTLVGPAEPVAEAGYVRHLGFALGLGIVIALLLIGLSS